MFTIRATYQDGKLLLHEPLHFDKKAKVLITVLNKEATKKVVVPAVDYDHDPDLAEDAFKGLRAHERYRAKGSIALVEGHEEYLFPLYDYSAGGLSFLSSYPFEPGRLITASVRDDYDKDVSILDFEFEVVRSSAVKSGYKVGCRFTDDVDEELWHSLIN